MLSLLLGSAASNTSKTAAQGSKVFQVARSWNLYLITPAMVLTWTLGLKLAFLTGWIGANWLWLKLALVLGLSAVYGLQSRMLRRLATGQAQAPGAGVELLAPFTVLATAGILALAVAKPF